MTSPEKHPDQFMMEQGVFHLYLGMEMLRGYVSDETDAKLQDACDAFFILPQDRLDAVEQDVMTALRNVCNNLKIDHPMVW